MDKSVASVAAVGRLGKAVLRCVQRRPMQRRVGTARERQPTYRKNNSIEQWPKRERTIWIDTYQSIEQVRG